MGRRRTRPKSRPEPPEQTRDADSQLFHVKHGVTMFWTLIGALLTFLATSWWQQRQGPQKVYVTNPDTTVRIAIGRDTALTRRIDQLSGEVRTLRSVADREPSVVVSGIDELPATNPVQSPIFRFPPGIEGYLASDIRTLASARCPRGPFRTGAEIPIRIRLKNSETSQRLTPLIVDVARRTGDRTITRVWEAQFEPQPDNFVLAPAPKDSGTYELTAGFYLTSELNTKYPPFYRLSCSVRVTG